ncbi:hypothetical protein [Metabacillus litoralis]|uniref:hypothetical protein n=1 Tax=Metabacillus litoralis TaxID=152268 RepID=UPI001CFD0A86|nr:hypothetical protein [Metabacillus litoralis]
MKKIKVNDHFLSLNKYCDKDYRGPYIRFRRENTVVIDFHSLSCEMEGEHRMKLPNGITGFYDSKKNKLPQVDGMQFKQLCYGFASRHNGKILNFIKPQYPTNFYYAQVQMEDHTFFILLNEHYHYLAFAEKVEFGNITFINTTVLDEQFSTFYQVMDPGELNISLYQNLINKSELNPVELEQIAYWKPGTLGQIIFNYWD